MITIHKSKNKNLKDRGTEEEKPKCPKCGSKNLLTMGNRGNRALSCLDCDYAEGVGIT